LIDFGLSHSYRNHRTGKHHEYLTDVGFVGTCRYASIHAHREQRLSRRDDLISWFYSIIELAHAKLPWPGQKDKIRTAEMKAEISTEELCTGLPVQFQEIWRDVKKLSFSATPHYRRYRSLLKDVIVHIEMAEPPKFDWEKVPQETFREVSHIPLEMGDPVELSLEDDSEGGCAACSVA
jgi:hypothetical protein